VAVLRRLGVLALGLAKWALRSERESFRLSLAASSALYSSDDDSLDSIDVTDGVDSAEKGAARR
jgi:hypothetical protein